MKKKLLTSLIIFWMSLANWALEIPQSTEEEGMNKLERINKIEKDLTTLFEEVNKMKKQMQDLKKEIKEELKRELSNK
ncbi:MAG: hypothetical protein A2381_19175 [Bdellovibrionales bacterium RIFOXYB1_FULL_37_110]|nr:MAG: hypothetical protein A2181_09445 [Bdellovibrionales bacterium RIFOXYA1_FULL_38_20]OFZ49500.1 MAG: hypothetical protein A2417_04325 [Bdellovibrionales bacterium RIFOXYC1_FULL_37_79]OFZ58654.1 MAG: hypothetical protein A2381_19175 [Bdellovibrionales bacterium RIFOXYB1_FULL_37_110]OFZ63015.1 MAG: hypothetical protein A2577_05370 [Bdellovibrionales bacterium RIFOXYD1_FULL_36_51]